MAQAVAPPGWPAEVRPPAVEGWERSAGPWLLDICPPEFRGYAVLRRHTVVLARFAAVHTEASLEASRRALGDVRTSLRDFVEPETVERAVQAWEREIAGAPSTWSSRHCAGASSGPGCEPGLIPG